MQYIVIKMKSEKPEFVWKKEFADDKFAVLMNILQSDIEIIEEVSDMYVQHANYQREDFLPELLHIEKYKQIRKKMKAVLGVARNLAMNIDDYLAKINRIETYEREEELVDGMKKCNI